MGAALGKTPSSSSKTLSTLVPSKQIKAVTGLQIPLSNSKYLSNVNNSCPPWVLPPEAKRPIWHDISKTRNAYSLQGAPLQEKTA